MRSSDHEERHAEELEGEALEAHLVTCVECALLGRMIDDAARADTAARAETLPLSDAALDAILTAAGGLDIAPNAGPLAPEVATHIPERAAPRSVHVDADARTQVASPVVRFPKRRWAWATLAFAAALVLAVAAIAAVRFRERRGHAPQEPAPSPSAVSAAPQEPAPEPAVTVSAAPEEPPAKVPSATVPRPLAAPVASASAARSAEPVETASALFARANEARRGGRAAEALRLYDELGARFPGSREDTAARVTSGWLLLEQLGQPGAALARFDRYLAVSGGGTLAQEAMAGRALSLARLGRSADELAAWRRLLEVAPGSAYAPRARERLGIASPSTSASAPPPSSR
ncbi:Hypothetical protein A7982_11920 [Minicystis rosea]|nr:Hypothetical protein A7982_11920 [Minicystis rosea]